MLRKLCNVLWISPTLLAAVLVHASPAITAEALSNHSSTISQATSEANTPTADRSADEFNSGSVGLSQSESDRPLGAALRYRTDPTAQIIPAAPSANPIPSATLAQPEQFTAESANPIPSVTLAQPEQPTAESANPIPSVTLAQPDQPTAESTQQVTPISRLADVQPTDWAFQALQSLVERYGCISGYPDNSFRGNRALTRYEFAAGLNSCLERLNELLSAGTADLVRREDLETLKRLQEDFTTELASLRGRVDALEAQTAVLETQQFSTTTKLLGNAIFALADAFGENGDRSQTAFQGRVSLNLASSFTGQDLLLLGLFSGNAPIFSPFRLPGATSEGTLSSQFGANTDNELLLAVADYTFPVGDKLRVHVVSGLAPFQLFTPTLNPYLDDNDSGTGAISIFGEYNPLYTLVGGGTGVGLNYDISPQLQLSAGYLADGLLVGNPRPGAGLFNGGYGVLGQLTWKVSKRFSLAGVYINQYSPSGRFGFNYNALGVTGTGVANTLAGQDFFSPVITNGYALQFSWQPSSKFSLSGWVSTFYPRLIGRGDGNILTYALTLAFPDLGKEGNLLGLVVGAEPYLTELRSVNAQPFKVDVPLHFEAFYRYQVADRISITPGLIWLTAPNQDSNNGSDVVVTIRTTFQF